MRAEREVGDEPFEPAVFQFYLTQPPQFAHAEMGVLLFSGVAGGLNHPELPAQIADRGAGLGLPDGVDDLLFGKS